jgi:molybdate transport system permease protein
MGEFGATVILAGNMQGEKATLALEIYNELGRPGGDENAMRLTLLSVFTSFIVLFIYERLLRRIDASPLQRKKNSRRKK